VGEKKGGKVLISTCRKEGDAAFAQLVEEKGEDSREGGREMKKRKKTPCPIV